MRYLRGRRHGALFPTNTPIISSAVFGFSFGGAGPTNVAFLKQIGPDFSSTLDLFIVFLVLPFGRTLESTLSVTQGIDLYSTLLSVQIFLSISV